MKYQSEIEDLDGPWTISGMNLFWKASENGV